MASYSFDTLNDKDFELLVRDLLQKKLGHSLESFKAGKDGGIDLRCSYNTRENLLIVQCKHWLKTGYDKLLQYLEKEEFPKAAKLKPSVYLLATSIQLSAKNKDAIIAVSNGMIKSHSQILGQEDLNNLIGQHPSIERDYYKLWYSSSTVFLQFLNNAVFERSKWTESVVKSKIQRFVQTQQYSEALAILNNRGFIVVKGEPGIGKTTLAEALLYDCMKADFEVISVLEHISEAEQVWDIDKRQVFYFDDFLGANYMQLIQEKNSDRALIQFIEKIKSNKNKKLILTSRTAILNQAYQNSEKLDNSSVKLAEHEVKVGSYNSIDKARILYNHLYFSEIPEAYFEEVRGGKRYWRIVKHVNYNPRIIEHVTNPENLLTCESADYIKFVTEKLDKPALIWDGAYRNQLNDYEKFLLIGLFTLEGLIDQEKLREVYDARLKYEVSCNGFVNEPNGFNRYLKSLLGSFISHTIYSNATRNFSLFNPSIGDFLLSYLGSSGDERGRIFESATFLCQLYWRFGIEDGKIQLSEKEGRRVKEILKDNGRVWGKSKYSETIEKIIAYDKIFGIAGAADELASLIAVLRVEDIWWSCFSQILSVLERAIAEETVRDAVLGRWRELIIQLLSTAADDSDRDLFLRVKSLFPFYGKNYSEFISDVENKAVVQEFVNRWWIDNIDSEIDSSDILKNSKKKNLIREEIVSLKNAGLEFNAEMGMDPSPALEKFNDLDEEEIMIENSTRDDEDEIRSSIMPSASAGISDVDVIDDLFSL